MAKDNEILDLMIGGSDGGIRLSTGITNGAYDLLIVESGVTFSALGNEAGTSVLTSKNLGSYAFVSERMLSAGRGHTFKTISFTGGEVWGYTKY